MLGRFHSRNARSALAIALQAVSELWRMLRSLAEGMKRKLKSFTKVGSIGTRFSGTLDPVSTPFESPQFHFLIDREL